MADPWSTDDLRLTDPDAFPGQGRPGSPYGTWPASPSTPSWPNFGDAPSVSQVGPTFPSAVAPSQSVDLWGQPQAAVTPYSVKPGVSASVAPAAVSKRRSGRLSVTAFMVVLLGTVLGAGLLYQSVASISLISRDPLGDGLLWLTGWVGMDIVITIGLILALIALIRGPRRGLAGISLAIGVLITPFVFLGAVQLGANTVQDRARSQLAGTAGAAEQSVLEYADSHGVDLGPMRPILRALLDDGR